MAKDIIIMGAGGQAKVIADIIIKNGNNVIGFLDDNKNIGEQVLGVTVLGKISDITKYSNNVEFVIGIGNNDIRKIIAQKYNVKWHIAIHPTAVIGEECVIEEGTVVMANAVINPSTMIGKHCIINTGAIVEHDNIIENYVHISPGVILGGTVKVGCSTHIGIGSVVKNNIYIGKECLIGAGAVVVRDITNKGTYIGVPAKKMN